MPLQRDPATGKISRNLDGKLACAADDCCEPTPCPDCCVRITSGALISGEIKIFAFDGTRSIEITIITASGTRIVCDGESIEIFVRYYEGEELVEVPFDAEIGWDPLWKFVDAAPVPDSQSDGIGGFVAWEDVELTVGGQEYLYVALQMNECWLNNNEYSFGLISVTVDGIVELIAVEKCNLAIDCCIYEMQCEPCCLALGYDELNGQVTPGLWTWNATLGRFEKIAVIDADPYLLYIVLWVKPAGDADPLKFPLWCIEDEVWEFGVTIYPGNAASVAVSQTTGVLVEACEFEIMTESLDPAWATIDGSQIDWLPPSPPERPATNEFTWSLRRSCEYQGCTGIPVFISIAEVNEGASTLLEVDLYECERVNIDGCECGCPCCGGTLPDNLTVEWTYDGVDYSFDLSVTAVDDCGENIRWWLIEPTMENMFPNCGPCGKFLVPLGGGCSEFDLHNIRIDHDCVNGWTLYLFSASGTNSPFGTDGESVCELPIVLTSCDIDYTISAV